MRIALCAGGMSHHGVSYIGVPAEALLHEGMMRPAAHASVATM
jgi:hypothetical protein